MPRPAEPTTIIRGPVTLRKTRWSYVARTSGSGPIVTPDTAPRVAGLTHTRR